MESIYSEIEAEKFAAHYPEVSRALAIRAYTSRLIGADHNLVLHGGGNTSVKIKQKNILGEEQEVLFVKGSGVDLVDIEPADFVALDLAFIRKLRILESLDDEEMENQLQIHKLHNSPLNPSVEALLHAFLPHIYVDHSHADSILVLTNQPEGPGLIHKALGPGVAVLPYASSGLPLAKAVAVQYENHHEMEAIVVVHHGIFTFADDAVTSYERMINFVNRAEAFITHTLEGKPHIRPRADIKFVQDAKATAACVARTIRGACAHIGSDGRLRRFLVEFRNSQNLLDASVSIKAKAFCDSGVLTPDHVIRTKNKIAYIDMLPENNTDLLTKIGQVVEDFVNDYHRYFKEQVKVKGADPQELDPYPRIFIVAGLGMFALGFSRKEAKVAADIAEKSIFAKIQADEIGQYLPITDSHIFDMEYWPLQQKKLRRFSPPQLQGQIALITGAGGAIGYGIADRLLASGAAVVLSDIDESRTQKVCALLKAQYPNGVIEIIPFDVTDYQSATSAVDEISRRLGGIDIVVPNAGIAHVAKIEDLEPCRLDQVIAVNFKGTFNTIKAAIPVFKQQGTGGNVIVISSKNVFDPGAAFGAYSASKAGAHQISKIAAMELAELVVRVNMINPDAVFGDEKISSRLWDTVGPDRMKSRGLDFKGLKDYYRNRNLLKAEVLAEHVGNAVVFFASDQTPTTGASLPVDGGIAPAFPR